MDDNKAWKGSRSSECKKCEIGKILEANMESYDPQPEGGEIVEDNILEANMESYESEPEEGEIMEEHKPPSSQNPTHKDIVASAIELSSSAKEAVEQKQVHIRESTSQQRASHGDTARGSHQGGNPSSTIVQQSEYTAYDGRYSNVGHSTLHNTWEHSRSYSPTFCISSKERHNKRKQDYFRYSDYRWVLQKINLVCSQRFNKLLLQQNEDRKKFEIIWKEQQLEFFKENVHSYKVQYTHVIPTTRNCSMKLPRLHFNIFREIFRKHMQSQLKIFVKQQIKDRNKEIRIKERWIFEAKAGYLKKCFYDMSLPYSEFKWEKLEWHMTDYSDDEEHLKYYDMQSLTNQIEAIASNRELEGSFISDVSEPFLKNSPSLLETNGATKLGFSVGVAEEVPILESRFSHAACAPTMSFCEKDRTQLAFSVAEAQNECGNMDRPDGSQSLISAALEPGKAVTAGKASYISEPNLETNGATDIGFSFDVAEKMATLESSSFQSTGAPAQIAFSAAAQNEAGNVETLCAFQSVTNALEVEMKVTTDPQNAPLTSKEKRKHISSSNDTSEGPCSRSQREFGEKDGEQITSAAAAQNEGGNLARSCASRSATNVALELSMTVNTDSENVAPISIEKRRRISPGNNISERPCSTSQKKFPYESASNLSRRTALHHEEPPVARPPPPYLANITQTVQAVDTRSKEVPCHQAQVTEHSKIHSNTQSSVPQYHCNSTCQTSTHTYGPPAGNDSLEVPIVHLSSANQVPTGYTPRQCVAEDGFQPNPLSVELHKILALHDLIEKMHKEKREQLILTREIELAEAKRKYEERMYNAEIEVLQKMKDLKKMYDKNDKQLRLAELYQSRFKASDKVVPDSSSGAAQRAMAGPSRSSDQHLPMFLHPLYQQPGTSHRNGLHKHQQTPPLYSIFPMFLHPLHQQPGTSHGNGLHKHQQKPPSNIIFPIFLHPLHQQPGTSHGNGLHNHQQKPPSDSIV